MLSNNNMFFERCGLYYCLNGHGFPATTSARLWLSNASAKYQVSHRLTFAGTHKVVCMYLFNEYFVILFYDLLCKFCCINLCVFCESNECFFFSFFYRGQICLRLSLYRLTSCIQPHLYGQTVYLPRIGVRDKALIASVDERR